MQIRKLKNEFNSTQREKLIATIFLLVSCGSLLVAAVVTQKRLPASVLAEKIESEDEDFDNDVDDISLQGIVSDFTGIAYDFIF